MFKIDNFGPKKVLNLCVELLGFSIVSVFLSERLKNETTIVLKEGQIHTLGSQATDVRRGGTSTAVT